MGARRSESGSRAQTLAARAKNEFGLRRHDDLPRCWISTPIEHLSTFEVWDYLRDDAYLKEIEQSITNQKEISLDTLRRLVAKVEEYGESHRAVGLQDELLQILQDDLRERQSEKREAHA